MAGEVRASRSSTTQARTSRSGFEPLDTSKNSADWYESAHPDFPFRKPRERLDLLRVSLAVFFQRPA